MVTIIYTTRLNRYLQFPTLHHVTDLALFIVSGIIIFWFQNNLAVGLGVDGLSEEERKLRIVANLADNIDFKF